MSHLGILKNNSTDSKGKKALVTAIIVAAGHSARMGGLNKQFTLIGGETVISRTISAFEQSGLTGEIVLVCADRDMVDASAIVKEYGFSKVVRIVAGGSTRQKSAAAGFAAINPGSSFVAVHDGARPLVTPQCIDRVISAGIAVGAAAAAVRVKDTIKIADENGYIAGTPDRSRLYAVQTPQVFETGLYARCLELAERTGADYTDDCQLAEQAGAAVRLIDGEYTNIKITTVDDLPFADTIISLREGGIE